MGGLDLSPVIENVSVGTNKNLGEMASCHVDLAVAHRNIDSIVANSRTDSAHLIGIGREAVLTVCLEKWKGLLIIDLPHPVRVAWDPFSPPVRSGDIVLGV